MVAGLFVLGLVELLIAPGLLLGAARTLGASTLKSFAVGAVVFLSTPFIVLLLVASVVGVPLMVIALSAYLVALATAFLVIALAVGGRILRIFGGGSGASFSSRIGMLAVGLQILFIIAWIPLLGALVGLIALILGL